MIGGLTLEMSGNEWPPFDGQEEGELANIDMSLPLSDSGNIKKTEDEIKYHIIRIPESCPYPQVLGSMVVQRTNILPSLYLTC